jgi:hypothetical protein
MCLLDVFCISSRSLDLSVKNEYIKVGLLMFKRNIAMKTNQLNLSKYITILVFILALVLPTNMIALEQGGDGDRASMAEGGSNNNNDDGGGDYETAGGDRASMSEGGSNNNDDDGGGDYETGGGDRASMAEAGSSGDAIPLDGGLGILVLGAAAFGIRKLRGKKVDN